VHRGRSRRRLAANDRDRQQALTRLGRTAWQGKVDLTSLGHLRGQLEQLDARAGDLSSTATRLEAERAELQARRQSVVDRFDALIAPAKAAHAQAETALRTARAALGKQPAAETAEKASLAADVNARAGETRRLSAEVARIDGERNAALKPLDADLERVRQASAAAAQERATVGRDQEDRFRDLGAALYERPSPDPALSEGYRAVAALDADRAATQAAIDGSLGLTAAMTPGTMPKFWAVVLLVPVVLTAAGYLLSAQLAPSVAVTGSKTLPAGAAVRNPPRTSVAADELRKDEVVAAFMRARTDPGRRIPAVEILAADVTALGSSADRSTLPLLLTILQRGEPELRAAAAHAVGMIGPTAAEAPVLMNALNDPVPAVREGVLHALELLSDPGARLLVLRARAGARDRSAGGLTPTVAPDAASLGTPIYPGATFLAFASDLDLGRVSFSSPDPVQKVVDFYAATAAGRPPLGGEEFTRMYFGGSADDPTGARALSAGTEAWLKRAVAAGTPPAELEAEAGRRASRMMSLPLLRYGETTLFGAPAFLALQTAVSDGTTHAVRYVVVFQDHALGRTGFEYHVAAEAIRR
jgi:hypothetical protein